MKYYPNSMCMHTTFAHRHTPGQHASFVNITTLPTTNTTTKHIHKQVRPKSGQTANAHHLFTQNIHHYVDYLFPYLMPVKPHNSLHSYAVVPLALNPRPPNPQLPLSHLPSLHLLHTVVVPRALLFQLGLPPPIQQIPAATIKELSADTGCKGELRTPAEQIT